MKNFKKVTLTKIKSPLNFESQLMSRRSWNTSGTSGGSGIWLEGDNVICFQNHKGDYSCFWIGDEAPGITAPEPEPKPGAGGDYNGNNSNGGEDSNNGGEDSNNGGGTTPPSPNPPKDTKPSIKEKKDCDEIVARYAQYTSWELDYFAEDTMDKLRTLAKNNNNEIAATAEWVDTSGSGFIVTDFREGDSDQTEIRLTTQTAYGIHTHTKAAGEMIGPSFVDIIGVIDAAQALKNNKDSDYRGDVIICHDGTEYFVGFSNIYTTQELNHKIVDNWRFNTNIPKFKVRYDNIRYSLEEKGYSKNDAHIYAIARMLKEDKTGIVITERKTKNDVYREIGTRYENGEYIPEKCS